MLVEDITPRWLRYERMREIFVYDVDTELTSLLQLIVRRPATDMFDLPDQEYRLRLQEQGQDTG